MTFELKLAIKYFRSQHKGLARFTSKAAIIGITVGVAGLIIANALARGFRDEMQDKILANTAHISIFKNDGAEMENWREIKEILGNFEKIVEVSGTTYDSTLIVGRDSTSFAILRVVETQNNQNKISIGAKLAEKTGTKIGDSLEIIMLGNQISPTSSKILVSDIFQTGLYEYDSSWVNITPEVFAKLTGKTEFIPTTLSVKVRDIYNSNEIADEIEAKLGKNFKVIDWQEANKPLFAALALEQKVALAIISLIIFIAALNITTTLALLVNERRFDIGILRTCGAKTKSLIFIFLIEGLLIGFIGIFFGVFLGLLCCFLGNYFQLIRISEEVYSLNSIPFHPSFYNILITTIITFLLCLTATIFPATKAIRIKPSDNLKSQ